MKKFLLLLVSTLCFGNVFAVTNYTPREFVGDCKDSAMVFYTKLNVCESHSGKKCIFVPVDYNCNYHVIGDKVEPDYTKPYYTKTQVHSCTDKENCREIQQTFTCEKVNEYKIINEDYTEVYCTSLKYKDKITKNAIVVIDPVKKAEYDKKKAQREALKEAISKSRKKRACANNVIDLMYVRNEAKQLTSTQLQAYLEKARMIIQALTTGALETAKSGIQNIEADGTVITEDDKTISVAEINKCLQLE